MTPDNLLQIAQISTIVIGGLGVFVALRSHRRQIHAQIFIEFSSRLHHVIREMPAQVWTGRHTPDIPLPPQSDELTRVTLRCFHIMADLYHLHRGGYISHDLWRPWQRGMQRTLQGPLMRREWASTHAAFSHYPEFCHYINELVGEPVRRASRFKLLALNTRRSVR